MIIKYKKGEVQLISNVVATSNSPKLLVRGCVEVGDQEKPPDEPSSSYSQRNGFFEM